MNEPCMVDWCDRPVGDGYVCQRCADRLERALGDVPALWEELDTVLTKQARYAAAEARRGERSLPFNPTASELGWVLRNTLAIWVKLVVDTRGVAGPKPPKQGNLASQRTFPHTVTTVADVLVQRCDTTHLPIDQCDHCRVRVPCPTST